MYYWKLTDMLPADHYQSTDFLSEFWPKPVGHLLRVVQYTRSIMGHQTGDSSWQIVMTRRCLSVRDMSGIRCRPPHFNKCLWCHYFRMRNIVTFLLPVYLFCLQVIMTCHELSHLVVTRYRSGVFGHVCICWLTNRQSTVTQWFVLGAVLHNYRIT